MEKEVKTTLWIEDGATRIETDFADFGGTVNEWKSAFYEVWRYQMTWGFAYSINVRERRNTGVYMSLLIKSGYKKLVLELLDDLGFGNVVTSDENIGVVQLYDIDDKAAEDVFEVFAE